MKSDYGRGALDESKRGATWPAPNAPAPGTSSVRGWALSRTREFDADLGALELTGDAMGLASALGKMERYQQRFLDRILATGRQVPAPSILRSHPNTEERISRLVELSEEPLSVPRADASVFGGSFTVPEALTQIERAPRWHVSGLWY